MKKRSYRTRSLLNLLKMGHCAPVVMKTIRDIERAEPEQEWLIRLAAGMPGGIGNTGFECGGITSPLVLLGLRYSLKDSIDGLPLLFYKGHDYIRRFLTANRAWRCWDIRGEKNYRLRRCIRAVRHSPELYLAADSNDSRDSIPVERREPYSRLYSHFAGEGFHCAHAVLRRLSSVIPVDDELLAGTSGFVGGTVMEGMTCSSLVAGVMALGLGMAEIEDSVPRVMKMIVLMKTGGDAFANRINKFNKIMNLGNELAQRFSGKFGGTQCRAITGADFSTRAGAANYVERKTNETCRSIVEWTACEVLKINREVRSGD